MTELEELCAKRDVRIAVRYGEAKSKGWEGATHNWRVTLRYERRSLSVDFFGGSFVTEVSAADVLSSLVSDTWSGELESFEDFCSEFGHDTDSRQAEKTYKVCRATAPRVRRFLGDDFEAFAQAEH